MRSGGSAGVSVSIRRETSNNVEQVSRVTIEAFAESEFGHHGEADLIATLRSSGCEFLSLVAESDNEVVGHILFTPATIRSSTDEVAGMGLGPMAVSPAYQGSGIGTALVGEGLKQLFARDCAFVVVLGHPAFYSRLGFRPAVEHGVRHGFAAIPQDVFLVQPHPRLDRPLPTGTAYYRSEFGPQGSDR